MATVSGTAAADFIHAAGDGRTVPPGYTDVVGSTAFADTIIPGLGLDIVYAGAGSDEIRVVSLADADGLAETIDGGEGIDFISVYASGTLT